MSKSKSTYVCRECNATASKWTGQCPACNEWNSLDEQTQTSAAAAKHRFAPLAGSSPMMRLDAVSEEELVRTVTKIEEFDRVLGGGVVQGGAVLLAGDPGVGKSTVLLQAMHALAEKNVSVAIYAGEESPAQVAMRARRLGIIKTRINIQAEVQLERILDSIEQHAPKVITIDSIQTVWSEALSAPPGSVSQVKECAAQLTRVCKAKSISLFFVGHVTKEAIAGPKALEHIVDTVLLMEGEAHSTFRILRSIKNRFGALELGVFSMQEQGLRCVSNPSAIFLSPHSAPVPGSCVMPTVDGTRTLLVEIQALVDAGGPSPRRLALGLERDRLAMLLAILNRHGGIQTADQDCFTNCVGGLRITEPGSDLPTLLAIQSSLRGKPLPKGLCVFGEVGLAGEVRAITKGLDRLTTAAKQGFTDAIVPKANKPKNAIPGLTVHLVERVEDALALVASM